VGAGVGVSLGVGVGAGTVMATATAFAGPDTLELVVPSESEPSPSALSFLSSVLPASFVPESAFTDFVTPAGSTARTGASAVESGFATG
jgi:hypothetical protein